MASETEHTSHFIPRKSEMRELSTLIPLKGIAPKSSRVFNVWGEDGVGKSSFISEYRESEEMLRSKVLWLQPTRIGTLDTVPEFIAACSNTVRYPAQPNKEKKQAERLAAAQRGKANPIVSDDSILIMRSSLAGKRKMHINQAAAASVGRTETSREESEVAVGLGESKAANHAEGFLDALPLKSLGTDLTILYIEDFSRLSPPVVDWLRDYVFPAATKGPYRRSLVILLESTEPLRYANPNESWGVWGALVDDYRLGVYSAEEIAELSARSRLEKAARAYVRHRSLGYPALISRAIDSARSLGSVSIDESILSLSQSELSCLAALCIPGKLYPNELDAILGKDRGAPAYRRMHALVGKLCSTEPSGEFLVPSEKLRYGTIVRACHLEEFKALAPSAMSLAQLQEQVPDARDRAKLLLLCGLEWIDAPLCAQLFGKQAGTILSYIQSMSEHFNRVRERYRISERLLDLLRALARKSESAAAQKVRAKAKAIWMEKSAKHKADAQEAAEALRSLEKKINSLELRRGKLLVEIRSASDVKSSAPSASTRKLHEQNQELAQKLREFEASSDALSAQIEASKDALDFPYL